MVVKEIVVSFVLVFVNRCHVINLRYLIYFLLDRSVLEQEVKSKKDEILNLNKTLTKNKEESVVKTFNYMRLILYLERDIYSATRIERVIIFKWKFRNRKDKLRVYYNYTNF